MENTAVVSYGAATFLKERLFDQSDPYEVFLCDRCGHIADPPAQAKQMPATQQMVMMQQQQQRSSSSSSIDFVGSRRARPYCRLCESSEYVVQIKMPYAEKLFMQEQMALHINPLLTTQSMSEYNSNVYCGTHTSDNSKVRYDRNHGVAPDDNIHHNISNNGSSSRGSRGSRGSGSGGGSGGDIDILDTSSNDATLHHNRIDTVNGGNNPEFYDQDKALFFNLLLGDSAPLETYSTETRTRKRRPQQSHSFDPRRKRRFRHNNTFGGSNHVTDDDSDNIVESFKY
jgi:hypothetical protein